jgi:uncharacterized 2Fe-2S/4Fe-4S cluster protein (DUF4445 family)
MPPAGWYNRRPAGARTIYTVRFLPEGRAVQLDGPTDLFQASAACGILLEQPCAGLTRCGRCRVRVVEGLADVSDADRDVLSPADIQDGWRLACALTVREAATIEVPGQTRSADPKGFGAAVTPDAGRVPPPRAPLPAGMVPLGLAVDIGTTSLAAALVALDTGAFVASGSVLNPQAEFGADVMSRIHRAGRDAAFRLPLVTAVRRGIAALANRLLGDAGARQREVVTAVLVGNPAMLHLWFGADPWGLGVTPYVGQWTGAIHTQAQAVELPIAPAAPVYVFPCVKSHVGADAVAAAVALGLDRAGAPALMIDLGTNSEIVLGDGEQMFAASTAAGPAFECGGISCGMRAAEGAIDALHLEPDGHWSAHVIGDGPPRGVCGSGLLDAVGELLRVGVIESSGYMRTAEQARGLVPDALLGRLSEAGERRRTAIVAGSRDAPGLWLEAADVRQLQLAVGAVRAGIDVLCADAGRSAADLQAVFVAGTFGQFVRKASMLRLGLLPPVPPERVRTVGNAAGAGAVLALLDGRVRDRAERLASRAHYVELAGRPGYQEALTRRLRFPAPEERP